MLKQVARKRAYNFLAQNGREHIIEREGKSCLLDGGVPFPEAFLDIVQKCERDSALRCLVRHAEEGNTLVDDVMKDMLVVNIAHLGVRLRNFCEENTSNRGEVTS